MGNLRATPLCALFLRPWPSERNLETVTNLNASRRECFNSFCWRKKVIVSSSFYHLLERSYRQGEGNKLPETIGPELHNEKSYFIDDKFLNGKQRFNGKLLGWICEWSVKKSKTLQRLAVSTRSPLGRCIPSGLALWRKPMSHPRRDFCDVWSVS